MARPSTIEDNIHCPWCSSEAVNKAGVIDERQRYRCKDCGKYFFNEVRRIPRHAVHTKVASLMFIAGASIKDICTTLSASFHLASRWVATSEVLVENEPDLQELKRAVKKDVATFKSFSDIPDKKNKRWLVIELEGDVAENAIIVVTKKT